MKPLARYAAISAMMALVAANPSSSAPEITRDKYNDSIRASVKLSGCRLIGSYSKQFPNVIKLNSCHFTAVSQGGVRTAWLEFMTSNGTWVEMSESIEKAGIFIYTPAGTQRLTQPAEWVGTTTTGGRVLESVIIKVVPASNAWNLLKSASKIEAKFQNLEYQAVFSPQDNQDIKTVMQSIF